MPDLQNIPNATMAERLSFAGKVLLSNAAQGTFTRNRLGTALVAAAQPDPLGVRLLGKLRDRYGACVFVKTFRSGWLVLFDRVAIESVLRESPRLFAEPTAKRRGMSHFQPNALTVSRGGDWQRRRMFNESVLDSGQIEHRLTGEFWEIVKSEVERSLLESAGNWCWPQIQRCFERITRQVLFGHAAQDDVYLSRKLTELMRRGNRMILPADRRGLADFREVMRTYLRHPEPNCLAAFCRNAPADAMLDIESQLTHWMFAMQETLAINVARALALISSRFQWEGPLRREVSLLKVGSESAAIGQMPLLSGCLQEAMRLWPTTPMIARVATQPVELCGHRLSTGTQIAILTGFVHRDPKSHPFADLFAPEIWSSHRHDLLHLHLSGGTQVCAGRNLAIWLGTAVLAAGLNGRQLILDHPLLPHQSPLPHAFSHFAIRFRVTSV